VDDRWMIPHFEKMLYDNGPLLALCCDAWAATGDPLFRDAAVATADWVIREMQSPEGGYWSTLDADSEGHEGRFYAWQRDEVRGVLSAEEYQAFAPCFGLDRPANFEGAWHLHGWRTPAEVAADLGLAEGEVTERIASARVKLFATRERRVHPGLDDKVLTAWNALMIKGMTRAARVLGRPDYLASAERALGFIQGTLWRNGRLLATYRAGRAHLDAYLDDYANLMDALLELLQVRWRREDLALAVGLAEVLLADFADPKDGGFYFTTQGRGDLICRPKPLGDESVPSGNGIAARALQQLGHLLGEPRYLTASEGTLRLAAESLRRIPYAHASLLAALDEYLDPPETVVIRGEGASLVAWQRVAQTGYRPRRLVLAIPAGEGDLPGALAGMVPCPGTRAYRCSGTQCSAPVEDLAALARELGTAASG
jgi:uncharacterized protein YyaL (SSP411 family)